MYENNTTQMKQPTYQNSPPQLPETSKVNINNAACDHSSSSSAQEGGDNFFFFSNDDSKSGYLECIVPDACFRPSTSSSSNDSSNQKTSQEAVKNNIMASSCSGGSTYPIYDLGQENIWDWSCSELAAIFNSPLKVEDTTSSTTTYAPSLPSFDVDFAYSLF